MSEDNIHVVIRSFGALKSESREDGGRIMLNAAAQLFWKTCCELRECVAIGDFENAAFAVSELEAIAHHELVSVAVCAVGVLLGNARSGETETIREAARASLAHLCSTYQAPVRARAVAALATIDRNVPPHNEALADLLERIGDRRSV